MRVAALVVALGCAACGGRVGVPGTGAAGTAGVSGAGGLGGSGADAGADGGSDAGWTACSSPDWQGCGTPDCPAGRPGCIGCLSADDAGLLSVCVESLTGHDGTNTPADGRILLALSASFAPSSFYVSVPFNAGILVAEHGQATRLAYADRGVWTGKPIPKPTACPSIANVPTCGGYCGGCPVGQICTGRSPLHPYGVCIPENVGVCSRVAGVNGSICSADEGCFIFTVEPARQLVADATGFCLPAKECQAMAAKLPGGGRCE